jgi:hypothetical protein
LRGRIPAVAKTTGTTARLLLPDGSERPVRRLAPPSIREQLWLLRRARRAGARAVVAECMAIQPELQWVSERDMVSATVGVITNVRTDHTDAMGSTLEEIAESLANTIPAGGTLVVGERRFLPVFERRAAALGTRVVAPVPDDGVVEPGEDWALTNRAIAIAVTRHLGIPDPIALAGMRESGPIRAVKVGRVSGAGRPCRGCDRGERPSHSHPAGGRGEDHHTTHEVGRVRRPGSSNSSRSITIVRTADRAARIRQQQLLHQNAAFLIVTGARPSLPLMRLVRAARPATRAVRNPTAVAAARGHRANAARMSDCRVVRQHKGAGRQRTPRGALAA